MASSYWIKLYQEILHDPKMCRLTDHQYRRCIELFLQAGETDRDGELPPVEDMAWTFRTDADAMLADMKALEAVGIVNQRNGTWIVTKFSERQAPVDGAERVARFRDRRHKAEYYGEPEPEAQPEPVTETVTESERECNDIVTNRYTDKIRLDKIRLDAETEQIRQDPALPAASTQPTALNISLSNSIPEPIPLMECADLPLAIRTSKKPPKLPPANPDGRQLSNPEVYEYIDRTFEIWKGICGQPEEHDRDFIRQWGKTLGRQNVLNAFERARGKLHTISEIYNSIEVVQHEPSVQAESSIAV